MKLLELTNKIEIWVSDLKVLEDGYTISISSHIENQIRDNFFKRLKIVLKENGEYYSVVKNNFNKYIALL